MASAGWRIPYSDGEEDYSAACKGNGEENENCTRFEEFDGEDTTRHGSEHSVYLLGSEYKLYNKENARADKEVRRQTCQWQSRVSHPFLPFLSLQFRLHWDAFI
jgi:hypothetical protein